nr:hypothetical protein [Barrientosiimonas endolithica]
MRSDGAVVADGAETGPLLTGGERVAAAGDHHGEPDPAQPDQLAGDAQHDQGQSGEHDGSADDHPLARVRARGVFGEATDELRVVVVQRLLHLVEQSLLVLGERHWTPPSDRADRACGAAWDRPFPRVCQG